MGNSGVFRRVRRVAARFSALSGFPRAVLLAYPHILLA